MLSLTELGHGRQGPHVRVEDQRSTNSMQNGPTYREVPTPILEGWLYTLQSSQAEMTEHEVMLFKEKGGMQTPKKYLTFDYLHR